MNSNSLTDSDNLLQETFDNRYLFLKGYNFIYKIIMGIILFIEIRIINNLKTIYERNAKSFTNIGPANVIPFNTIHMITDASMIKQILVHHRNDPNGFFGRTNQNDVGSFVKVTRMYMPAEEGSSPNDYVLGSEKEFSKIYRKFLLQIMNRASIKNDFLPQIKQIVSNFVTKWVNMTNHQPINMSKQIRYLICTMISKVLIGWNPPNDSEIEKLADAIDLINQFAANKLVAIKVNNDQLNSARNIIKVAVDDALSFGSTKLINNLLKLEEDGTFTRTQSRLLLCTLFMTGQETSVTALIELFWQLAINKNIQTSIVDDISAEKVVIEGLRTKSPAYTIPRHVRVPLNIKNYGTVYPKETIVVCPFLAAQNPNKYPNPSIFDFTRHTDRNNMDWSPFGSGAHRCIGSDFYFAEAITLIRTITEKYIISTPMQQKPTCKSMITEHFDEDLFITFDNK